ncbi:hypothetical protein G5I_01324 [Acromyrmex echinatior]|uniref:Uncharacterized protein n=1 Tax=Acromyrmex echinatior TaxID=103372 RepID=F4W7B0_ACREC|nr:hypothetical protein G5I_01324 [Acromyrmex echinatior]
MAKFRKLGLTRAGTAGNSEPARPIPVGSLAAAQQSSCDARPREQTLGSGSELTSGTPPPPPTPLLVLSTSSFFSLQLFLLPLPTLERRFVASAVCLAGIVSGSTNSVSAALTY